MGTFIKVHYWIYALCEETMPGPKVVCTKFKFKPETVKIVDVILEKTCNHFPIKRT